jgi:hypothetical protein
MTTIFEQLVGHRTITGTDWPIVCQIRHENGRGSRSSYTAIVRLCNGVPEEAQSFDGPSAAFAWLRERLPEPDLGLINRELSTPLEVCAYADPADLELVGIRIANDKHGWYACSSCGHWEFDGGFRLIDAAPIYCDACLGV